MKAENTTTTNVQVLEKAPVNIHTTDNEDDKVVMKFAHMAGGTAMQPLGALRNIGLLKLQLRMLKELSKLHNVEYSEYTGKALIIALIGNLRAQHADDHSPATWFRLMPGFSLLKETVSFPDQPEAITYATGRVFQKHFEHGGNLLNFSTTEAESIFSDAFAEARFIIG